MSVTALRYSVCMFARSANSKIDIEARYHDEQFVLADDRPPV
jgi:hypothetical protein